MATSTTPILSTTDATTSANDASNNADARIDVDLSVDKVPISTSAPTNGRSLPNSHIDYVSRRAKLWEGQGAAIEMGAVVRLPLPLQVAFRCKMLTIFALQLLFVGVLVGLCAFYPPMNDFVKTGFQVKVVYLGATAGTLAGLLVLLYLMRALFPLNWVVLFVFSVVQAALFAALGVKFDTHLGVFNCAATLACVVIMLLLAPVRVGSSAKRKLLSPVAAGLIAYTIVALAACALYVRFGREFVTPEGFGASLAFQFVLILWFAFDAAFMYRVMSPDEYMHGVIYFYTDMIVLAAVCAAAAAIAAIVVATLGGGGDCNGSCDCSGCNSCSGCSSCDGWDNCDGSSDSDQVAIDGTSAASDACTTWTWSDCLVLCVYVTPTDCTCGSNCKCCNRKEKAYNTEPAVEELDWSASPPYQSGGDAGWVEPHKSSAIRDQEMQRV